MEDDVSSKLTYSSVPLDLLKRLVRVVTFQRCFRNPRIETTISELTDELMTDILSRIPANNILACRLVCPSWHRLTRTTQFLAMHSNRAAPVIFGGVSKMNGSIKKIVWFFIDDFRRKAKFEKVDLKAYEVIRRCIDARVEASCNGLLIFGDGKDLHVICNPVTREEVQFSLKQGSVIAGFYFHPSQGEYKLLCYVRTNNNRNTYYVHSFSSTSMRTSLGNPIDGYNLRDNQVGVVICGALFLAVIRNKVDHGMSLLHEKIVMFDLETENFVMKPQPTDRYKRDARIHVKLLEIEGRLACCDVYVNLVEVWILEDIESWSWVKRFVVDLDVQIDSDLRDNRDANFTIVVGYQNGNLLLFRNYVGLLWCNLRLNTVKKIKRDLGTNVGTYYCVQYTGSLASLRSSNILPQD